jgi:flagellar motor protein MotB
MELYREKRITEKLKSLIDSGALRVRRRNGRLVLELPGDVHFSPGSAKLTDIGQSALGQLAPVLGAETDRLFVVEGHTDNQPIKMSGFRSNWHLGSRRAEVSREALVAAGLDPKRVALASWADVMPACPQVDEPECRQRNRRVEVVLLPRFE